MKFIKAFTLLELVFVMIIIGILSTLVFPYVMQEKNEAKWVRLKMDYQMISSALALMRYEAELKHLSHYSLNLDKAMIHKENEKLFYYDFAKEEQYSILKNPIISSYKGWMKIGENRYRFYLNSKKFIDFMYDFENGALECIVDERCKDLI